MFTVARDHWYAWQMFPGYGGLPYCSPILVGKVEPLKSGSNLLRVGFLNLGYAAGAQGFEHTLKVLQRTDEYLLTTIDGKQRAAVITDLSFEWLESFFPHMLKNVPLERCSPAAKASVSSYLNEVVGR